MIYVLKFQVMGKCESVAEAEKENCMSQVFATFLFLRCCVKLKGGRDIRTGRESTVVENYRSNGVFREKKQHRGYSQDQSRDVTNSGKRDFTPGFLRTVGN